LFAFGALAALARALQQKGFPMTETSSYTERALCVFEHQKRREWGVAIIAWERKHSRGYLFENGELRILARDFYPMMREVDLPQDEVHALYAYLRQELKAVGDGRAPEVGARPRKKASLSFDEQLVVFRHAFPGGFNDEKWEQAQRGTGIKKRVAAHRDAAIADAGELLAAKVLRDSIAQQRFRQVSTDAVGVLQRTDLVPSAELGDLSNGDAERQRGLACAVTELLHGQAGFAQRFDHFLVTFQNTFGRTASWPLATALSALLSPSEHVCVRPSTFREQAKWMAPTLSLPNAPSAASYQRALAMTKVIYRKLIEHAEKPRDLMDVHDFMRVTTGGTAKKRLAALGSTRAAEARSST
jgi:hypothetical protein